MSGFILWKHTDSNRGPSACKADALNQLSYASKGSAKINICIISPNSFSNFLFPYLLPSLAGFIIFVIQIFNTCLPYKKPSKPYTPTGNF